MQHVPSNGAGGGGGLLVDLVWGLLISLSQSQLILFSPNSLYTKQYSSQH